MQLDYDQIRKIHRLEKNTSKLVEVEPDFYNQLNSFIRKEKKSYLSSLKDFSSTKARDFANLKKMVEEIFNIREKKILGMSLVASRTKEYPKPEMAIQENKIYREMLVLLEQHNRILEEIFSSEKKKRKVKDLNNIKVKILSEVPSFVGTDMKEYGPFKKSEVVVLPYKIARLLDSRKLAKISEKVR